MKIDAFQNKKWLKNNLQKTRIEVFNYANQPPEVLLYGIIGFDGITSEKFVNAIADINSKMKIRINSPGGNTFEGMAIYNAIQQRKYKTIVQVDSMAGSAAGIIALSGNELHMFKNSFIVNHRAFKITIGNASEHRKEANALDLIDKNLVNIIFEKQKDKKYQKDEIFNFLEDELWWDSEKAKEWGIVDSIIDESPEIENNFDLSIYDNVPAELQTVLNSDVTPGIRDAEKALRDAGFTANEAKRILSTGFKAENQRDVDLDIRIAAKVNHAVNEREIATMIKGMYSAKN